MIFSPSKELIKTPSQSPSQQNIENSIENNQKFRKFNERPLFKLSIELLKTYQYINQVNF